MSSVLALPLADSLVFSSELISVGRSDYKDLRTITRMIFVFDCEYSNRCGSVEGRHLDVALCAFDFYIFY